MSALRLGLLVSLLTGLSACSHEAHLVAEDKAGWFNVEDAGSHTFYWCEAGQRDGKKPNPACYRPEFFDYRVEGPKGAVAE